MKNLGGHLKSILGFPKKQTGEHLSFKTIFSHFRDVLDNNNRALEIITDMGEKLGGDYLFDITYIKNAYSELSATVYDSLQSFDLLTRNRHPELHNVYDRIDNQIKRMIYDITASGEMIIFYNGITWDRYHEVGGKNASLAELKNYLNLNVPDAFVITTHAFDEFIKYNSLNERINSLSEDSGITESMFTELQDLITHAEFPPHFDTAIGSAIEKIRTRCGERCFLAVRSSAEEEDADFSFAGQFETRLNVPLESKSIKEAYKEVLASLFSPKAVAYQRQLGYPIGRLKMAVGFMVMVDATSSGVIYSTNPDGGRDTLIINAAWGLGRSIVEGHSDADLFVVKKSAKPGIIDKRPGKKESMIVMHEGGGTDTVKTPDRMKEEYSLTREQAMELARQAILIEKHFRKPQDIEWAVDKNGRVFILQARPLRIQENKKVESRSSDQMADSKHVLIKDRGTVVQKGIGAGRVFIVKHLEELDNFPKGAVLVARHDSSDYIRIMPYVSAIITDVGTPTSHMASLCREFRVPTIVNTGGATEVLTHGHEVTVVVGDDGGITVYEGLNKELMELADANSMRIENIYEFRKKRYILRYISPLNLIDPLLDNFTPEGCKTMHDILRFIHEKSVAELVDNAKYGSAMLKKHAAVKLDIPIPAGIMVIDIGGGLNIEEGQDKVTFEQITSVPLRAIIKGMMHPGVWHSDMVSLKAKDFLSSMMRMSDITMDTSDYVGYNVAVASKEYVNLSLRFGYHFNMIDCYCSENMKNNHIYFRFVGGATDITKRSRRVELIAAILKEYGFNIKTKGDLIVARLANMGQREIEDVLNQIGRLIAYTRQLDAVMHDDRSVERHARNFLRGNYEF